MNTYFTWPCHETQWQIFSELTRTDEREKKKIHSFALRKMLLFVKYCHLLTRMQIQIKSKSQMGWILPHSGGMIYKEIDNRMHSRCRRELPPQLGWILPHWIGILSRLSVGGSRLWLAPGFSWEELWFLVVLDQASPPLRPSWTTAAVLSTIMSL